MVCGLCAVAAVAIPVDESHDGKFLVELRGIGCWCRTLCAVSIGGGQSKIKALEKRCPAVFNGARIVLPGLIQVVDVLRMCIEHGREIFHNIKKR